MNARDTILARIREALRTPAPPPHVQSQQAQDVALTGSDESPGLTILPIDVAKPWLPDGGNSSHEQLQILTDNLTKLKAEVIRVTDMSTAIDEVKKLVQQNKWEQIGYHNHPRVRGNRAQHAFEVVPIILGERNAGDINRHSEFFLD